MNVSRYLCVVFLVIASVSTQAGLVYPTNIRLGARKTDAKKSLRSREEDPLPSTLVSLQASLPLEARKYRKGDLVKIIIKESSSSSSIGKAKSVKEYTLESEVSSWPDLDLKKLMQLMVKSGKNTNLPKAGLSHSSEFKGDAKKTRKDTISDRIRARVIDVKPNGTLVLEARKYLKSDGQTVQLILTGTCSVDDLAKEARIESSDLYDLRIIKRHSGNVARTTKKGWLTRVIETIFGF